MQCDVQKAEVDHSVITKDNYKSEVVRQNIREYQRLDCEVLYKAFTKYCAKLSAGVGFDVM
jgi:hypothetical protein